MFKYFSEKIRNSTKVYVHNHDKVFCSVFGRFFESLRIQSELLGKNFNLENRCKKSQSNKLFEFLKKIKKVLDMKDKKM